MKLGTLLNFLLGMMSLVYISFISKAVWDNIMTTPGPPPINITKAMINDELSGGTLELALNGTTTQERCEHGYILGSIIDSNDNEVLLDKIVPLESGELENLMSTPIPVRVPFLPPGLYRFRTEIHEICNKKSFIILAPLAPFTVSRAPLSK